MKVTQRQYHMERTLERGPENLDCSLGPVSYETSGQSAFLSLGVLRGRSHSSEGTGVYVRDMSPLSLVQVQRLCSPERLTLTTVRPQQERKEKILCFAPETCFAGGAAGMAWVHFLPRPSWSVHFRLWAGLEWPELNFSFPPQIHNSPGPASTSSKS